MRDSCKKSKTTRKEKRNKNKIIQKVFKKYLTKLCRDSIIIITTRERREVNIMTVIIEYANISPAVLETLVRAACINAFCTYRDIDEEYFEFSVCGWLPLTGADLIAIEGVLAQYV